MHNENDASSGIHTVAMRFLVVGVISTVINYSIYFLLIRGFEINYLVSSASGFLAGVAVGYFLNKNWTYSVSQPTNILMVARYLAVYVLSLVAGLAFLYVLVDKFSVHPLAANVAAIMLTTCTNFLGTKFFAFR